MPARAAAHPGRPPVLPLPLQVRGRWVPPWHVLVGAALLITSLFHYLSGPTGAWLENFSYIALGAVALCLPLIALRALLALRRGVSRFALCCAVRCSAVRCAALCCDALGRRLRSRSRTPPAGRFAPSELHSPKQLSIQCPLTLCN